MAEEQSGSPLGALIKTAVFLVVVPGIVLVYLPSILIHRERELLSVPLGSLRFVGLLPIALGLSMLLRCAWSFAVVGRGTPAPIDPPRVLVVDGLYRYVRNPMYVGVGMALVGEAILFGSGTLIAYAAAFWIPVYLFVVFYEEPTLRRRFGRVYEDYIRHVPRWIPRATPYEGIRSA